MVECEERVDEIIIDRGFDCVCFVELYPLDDFLFEASELAVVSIQT